jgi:hypothetical protein
LLQKTKLLPLLYVMLSVLVNGIFISCLKLFLLIQYKIQSTFTELLFSSFLTCICLRRRLFLVTLEISRTVINLAYRNIVTSHRGHWPLLIRTRYVCTCVSAGSGMGGGIRKIKAIRWDVYYYSLVLNVQPCKYDMYKSSLRHIHDPVFSSLKMKGIRLLFHYFSVFSNIFYYHITLQSVAGLIIVTVPLRHRSLRNGKPPALYLEIFVLKLSNFGSNIICPGRDFKGFYQTFRSTVAVITQTRQRLPFHVKFNFFHLSHSVPWCNMTLNVKSTRHGSDVLTIKLMKGFMITYTCLFRR